jgi:hypothetical protein
MSLTQLQFIGCGGLWEQIPYQGLDPQCECFTCLVLCLGCGLTGLSLSHHCQDQVIVSVDLCRHMHEGDEDMYKWLV